MHSTNQKPGDLNAQARMLKNLVEYGANSVVSREIINKQTGTVTVFAFDQGQGLSEHTAPFDALVYIIDGEALITISGNKHSLKGGELIIMPAHEPHALRATKKFKMLLVMIKS
jgi:quercetin dioxygenase-like cupin family protein